MTTTLPKSTAQAVAACAAFGLHYWADAPSTGGASRYVRTPSPVVWGLDERTRTFVPIRVDRKNGRAAIVGVLATDGTIHRYERSQLAWRLAYGNAATILATHAEQTALPIGTEPAA